MRLTNVANICSGLLSQVERIVFRGVLLSALVLAASVSSAQDDDNLKGELEIVKNAKIDLGTANRNFEKINNVQPIQAHKPLEYKVQEIELTLPKLDTKVKVVTIKGSELTKLYGNYVKVGFGNYTTPYLEGFFNNKRSEKYSYGAHLKHYSSKNGPVGNSGMSENQVNLYGNYYGKATTFFGNAGLQRNRYNFYGYDHSVLPSPLKDSLKQVLTTFSATVGFQNRNKNNKFNYYTDLNYFSFGTYTKAAESEVLWNAKADYWIDPTKKIFLNGGVSYSKRSDSSSISRTLFWVNPAFEYTGVDKLSILGGFNVAFSNDTTHQSSSVHIYPKVHAEYKVLENKVILFAGIDGGMIKNTLRTLSKENPYLISDIQLFHTNKTLDLYAGIKGGLKGGISYSAKVASTNYKYLSFYNPSTVDSSQYSVIYDDGNVNVLNAGGDLGYELSSSFRLGLAANYYSYNLSKVEKAWHRPDFVGSVLATYNLNQKVYFNADFYYIGGLRGKNYLSGQEIKLKPIADLNLKIDYLFSKSFSVFVEANNILSQKYQRYVYYPSKGINVLAGLTYSF